MKPGRSTISAERHKLETVVKRSKEYDTLCKKNHTLKQYEKHVKNMEKVLREKDPKIKKKFRIQSSNHSEVSMD